MTEWKKRYAWIRLWRVVSSCVERDGIDEYKIKKGYAEDLESGVK
jgi:hypothetical protein